MSYESSVYNLIQQTEFDDPRMYDLLTQIATDLYNIQNELHPPTAASRFGVTGQINRPATPTAFTGTVYGNNFRLTWDTVNGAVSYEIRYNTSASTDWDGASVLLKTATLAADVNPLTIPLVIGTYTFLLKSVDSSGNYAASASVVGLNVPVLGTPTITGIVVGNFVLLTWTAPNSLWDIAYYNVYKDASFMGDMKGTFEAIFETTGGTFVYSVEAVDIVGNVSPLSVGLSLMVSDPSDFLLLDTITAILLSGTTTSTKVDVDVNKLIGPVNTSITYEHHFIDNSWSDPQAQITAGYPFWIEPSEATGEYQYVFDFGSISNNVIIVVSWNKETIVGTVNTGTTTIEYSDDNITYSSPVTATSVFAASLRYVKLKLKLTSSGGNDLAYFSNIQCLLNVHRENDGGNIDVFAADGSGTEVFFNKPFRQVESITVTPISTVLQSAVYDFDYLPGSDSFFIFLFDDTGARVDGTVAWTARGIL